MKDECSRYEDKLSAYTDGRLSPDEMAKVAAHLEGCPACASLLEKMRRVEALAQGTLPEFDESLMDRLANRIAERLDEPAGETRPAGPRMIPIWYRYVAVAASVVLVFLVGRVALKESGRDLLEQVPAIESAAPMMIDTLRSRGIERLELGKPADTGAETMIPEEKAARPSKKDERMAPSVQMADDAEPPSVTAPPAPRDKREKAAEIQAESEAPKPGAVEDEAHLPDYAEHGNIKGRVIDSRTGKPLANVLIQLEGTDRGAKSNVDGEYFIQGVRPDTYNLVYSTIGYEPLTLTELAVDTGQTAEQIIAMNQAILEAAAVAEVTGSKKGIDVGETDMQPAETTEVTTIATGEAAAMSDLPDSLIRAVLPGIDSLDIEYAALLSLQESAGKKGAPSAAAFKAASEERRESPAALQLLLDSLEMRFPKAADPAEQVRIRYLQTRASLDLARITGGQEEINRASEYERKLEELLIHMIQLGYDRKELDRYRHALERLKRNN